MACEKQSFQTRKAAHRALKSCTRHRRGEERAYQCNDCGHWHLTSYGKHESGVYTIEPRQRKPQAARSQGVVFDDE